MTKKYYLPGLEEWDDFDRVVNVLTKNLSWTQQRRFEGPDAQVGEFTKGPLKITLVYSDTRGMRLQHDGDAPHLPAVGQEILAALEAKPT